MRFEQAVDASRYDAGRQGVRLGTSYEAVPAIFKDERFVKNRRKVRTPEQLVQIPPIPQVMEPLSRNIGDTDTPTEMPPAVKRPRAVHAGSLKGSAASAGGFYLLQDSGMEH